MKFFKNLLGTSDELTYEDHEKINSMMGEKPQESSLSSQPFSFEGAIDSLISVNEINKVRNLLDQKERQLTGNSDLHKPEYEFSSSEKENVQEIPVENIGSVNEINVEERIDEQDLNHETYEEPVSIDEISTPSESELPSFDNPELKETPESSEEFIEIPHDTPVMSNSSEFKLETERFYDRLSGIFGEENLFHRFEENSTLEYASGKEVFHIGIREKQAFGRENSTQEENSWFISHIKELGNDLLKFKMIRSEDGIKDLIWEREDGAILLSFRATVTLSSQEEFDFNL